MSDKVYIPKIPSIGRNKNTENLYRFEEKRNSYIKKAARELGAILDHQEGEFWKKSMPEQLASILDNFQGGKEAAIGYLTAKGYTVCLSKTNVEDEIYIPSKERA